MGPFIPFRYEYVRMVYLPFFFLLPVSFFAVPILLFTLFKHTAYLNLRSPMHYTFLVSASLFVGTLFLLPAWPIFFLPQELFGEGAVIKQIFILLLIMLYSSYGLRYLQRKGIEDFHPAIYRQAILCTLLSFCLVIGIALLHST